METSPAASLRLVVQARPGGNESGGYSSIGRAGPLRRKSSVRPLISDSKKDAKNQQDQIKHEPQQKKTISKDRKQIKKTRSNMSRSKKSENTPKRRSQ